MYALALGLQQDVQHGRHVIAEVRLQHVHIRHSAAREVCHALFRSSHGRVVLSRSKPAALRTPTVKDKQEARTHIVTLCNADTAASAPPFW